MDFRIVKFALATANPGKIREMREILERFGIDITTRKELGIDMDVEETGSTFAENALIKAKAICEASGFPSIADDSGLCVETLGGAPGIYSSTFGGADLNAEQRCEYITSLMKNMEHRSAKFVCVIVCVFPDGNIITAEGECRGEVIYAPRGSGGFGYDPVFLVSGADKTMAELSQEEKNEVSHRGKALRRFSELLDVCHIEK